MLDTSPRNLAGLVAEAEAERDERLDRVKEREQTAMGAMGRNAVCSESPENLAAALFATLIPSMVTSSPVVQVRSSGGYQDRLQGAALASAGSMVAKKTAMHEALESAAWDFLFQPFTCLMVEKPEAQMRDLTDEERSEARGRLFATEQDVGGEEGDTKAPRATPTPRVQTSPRWPRVKRIHPRRCGYDSAGDSIAEARFTWHEATEDRETLIERATDHPDDWIRGAIEGIPLDTTKGAYKDSRKQKVNRNQVCYYVVYVPGGVLEGEKPGPNSHGTIHTMAAMGSGTDGNPEGVEIRRPYYWSGHPQGPHIFEGQYTTGADSFFTTILAMNEDSVAMLDAVSASVMDRIRNHKTVFVYDSAAEAQMADVINAKDGAYVSIPGLRDGKGVIERVETSGVSAGEVGELQLVQQNAARGIGLGDALRGNAKSGTTATADSIAANTTRTKTSYVLSRWHRAVRKALEAVLWEIAHDERVAIRLDEQGRADVLRAQLEPFVQRGMMSPEGLDAVIEDAKAAPVLFQGGDFADEDGELDWWSLDIDIQPHSLDGNFGEEAFARESIWNQQLATLGQLALQQPHIDWTKRIKDTARALGFDVGDSIINRQIAEAIAQVQLASGAMGDPTVGGGDSPQGQGATLRVAGGGAASPSGVDPGTFQMN